MSSRVRLASRAGLGAVDQGDQGGGGGGAGPKKQGPKGVRLRVGRVEVNSPPGQNASFSLAWAAHARAVSGRWPAFRGDSIAAAISN
jgi:hypothetical protein